MRALVCREYGPIASRVPRCALVRGAAIVFGALPLVVTTAWAQPPSAPAPGSAPAPISGPAAVPASAPAPASASASGSEGDTIFAQAIRAYHAALLARRLGQHDLRKEDVAARVAEGEQLMSRGRVDEAIALLEELVEGPQFELYADSEDGRAAVFRLGDALAEAGVFEPARGYLRRVIEAKGAWDTQGFAIWARRR
jgi:hypothetical protein